MSDYITSFSNKDIDSYTKHSQKNQQVNYIIDNNDKRFDIKNLNKTKNFSSKDDTLKVTYIVKQNGQTKEEEILVPKFKKTKDNILNKGIILYGPTGSGKTRIIRDFMHLTKNSFPIVFAFAPTNAEKHDYDALIPKPLVFENFGLKEIKEIYNRQRSTTEVYNNANNLKTLHSLFNRVASAKARIYLKKINYFKERALKDIFEKYESLSEKNDKKEEIELLFKEKLICFYKQIIIPNIKKLQQMNLTQEERFALRYRNLNAKTLIMFDDAFTEVMKLIREGRRKEDETIKNFFFKGRHANITHWYAFQDDNRLDSDIRKNAHISVFTDKQVALAYFSRGANSFSLQEKKRAEAVINTVFDEEKAPKFAKLIYSRLDKNKFYYIVADEYEDKEVQMCSTVVKEYCKKIASKEGNFDTTNPYFQLFQGQIA